MHYAAEEIDGSFFNRLLVAAEEDLNPAILLIRLQRDGHYYQGEHQLMGGNGESIPVFLNISAIKDQDGEPLYFLISIIDITERKRAEEALRESEARYKSLFQNNHAVMLLLEPESGEIVDANPSACSYYGWPQSKLIGRSIFDINTKPRMDVRAEMASAENGNRNYFVFEHRLANGEIRDVEVYSGPIVVKGKNLLYSIVHDISARRRAERIILEREQELQNLIANTPGIFYRCSADIERGMQFISAGIERLTGYSP
ncbi:MAG: PAS domain S-box protein, partial [Clostridia bacterium]|nr:PAS domain S-box protein [Clostridia bacterium]